MLKQLENQNSHQAAPRTPDWIGQMVADVTLAIEPMIGEARVGYECRMGDTGWQVVVFVGRTEVVGGCDDGSTELVDFRLNLSEFVNCFDTVNRCDWIVYPAEPEWTANSLSFLHLEGEWRTQPVSVRVCSTPPEHAGPGARRYPDGHHEPV